MSLLRELTKPIADKIRFFLNVDDLIPPSQFDKKIDEVYEAGKQAEELKTWERFTGNGTRKNYVRAFEESDYSGYTFIKPIAPTESASQCFQNYIGTELPKNLDFTNINFGANNRIENLCYRARNLKEFPDINLPAPPLDYWYSFYQCGNLEKIAIIRCIETTKFTQAFQDCSSLIEIRAEGTIGTNFDIHWSPLTPTSLKSIIKHLKNYFATADEYKYTLTVKASAWEALEAEGLTDEDWDWVVETFKIDRDFFENVMTWETIVDALRWNLVLVS